jgi:high-affinity iron transporter
MILICILMTASASVLAEPVVATETHKRVQSIVSALDYIAIDYPAAVKDGLIINPAEYAEQLDFLTTVQELLQALPGTQNRGFLEQARVLEERLEARAPGIEVSQLSRALTADLLATYKLEVTPRTIQVV